MSDYNHAFEDKAERQQFEIHHSQASTCLPSTAEGTHPALVLIRQKGLVCSQVCQERVNRLAEVVNLVSVHLRESVIDIDMQDENSDGRIDQAEFKSLLLAQIGHVSAQGHCTELEEDAADVLLHFVPLDKDCLVADEQKQLKSKLKLTLVLWCLVCQYREEWLTKLKLPIRKAQLLTALSAFNCGSKVEMREALWIREKFWSINSDAHLDETKLLLCVAYWFSAPQARPIEGLNRKQLIQRIELERRLWNGLYRFVLWVGVFLLFSVALIEAGELRNCRGIKGNLETQLQLGDTAKVTTMQEVSSYVKAFSKASAKLAPLSRVYFGGGSVWNLQDGLRRFTAPVPLPYMMVPEPNDEGQNPQPLNIGGSFTLQAWVQFDGVALPWNGVSILRKALEHVGSTRLSCWDWRFPPAISFGAHDYGRDVPNTQTYLMEELVAADYPEHLRQEMVRSVLHTVLVTPTSVTFMVDNQVVSTKPLARPITDCESQDITLGDRGLTLAAVRYYPRELTVKEVRQIFRAGTTWRDIGQVISPQQLKVMSETATMSKTLRETIEASEATVKSTEDATWTAAAMTTASLKNQQSTSPYINANHAIPQRAADPTLGYRYWEIYTTPLYTDVLSKNLAPGLALPPRPGRTGFSLSAWLKVDSSSGSGYFMALSMPRFSDADVTAGNSANPLWTGNPNQCWMIWVGASYTGFYTQSGLPGRDSGPTYFVKDQTGPEAWHFTGKSYRHFVFQIDPQDTQKPIRVCIDGVCTGQAAIDSYAMFDNQNFPPAASCEQTGIMQGYSSSMQTDALNQTRLYLNRRPIDNFPMTTWQMQTKYFDRVLTEAEIQRLFERDPDPSDASGRPIRQTVGCKLPSELRDDPAFRDDFGNNCYWYFLARRTRPAVCLDAAAMKACPVACDSFEVCWGANPTQGGEFQIWRQQMEFRTKGKHGTMCVANSTTPEAEAIKCALNAPDFPNCRTLKAQGAELDCGPRDCTAFESDRERLLDCLGNTRWVPKEGARYDYSVPCRDIMLLAMPSCTWDDSGLDSVAATINSTSGSWSMSFWFESLLLRQCTQPQVRLLDGSGSTFSWVGAMGGFVEDVRAGPGWLTGCSQEPWLAHGHIGEQAKGFLGGTAGSMSADVTMPPLQPGTKHFVVFGRRADDSIGLHLDEREDFQRKTDAGLKPLLPDKNFLRVINIGGDVRMSPMTLRTYFPSVGEIGHMRFTSQVSQDLRTGPRIPLQDQLSETVLRQHQSYAQKTMLLIPPLLLQRRNKAAACHTDFSQEIVRKIHAQGLESQCISPYECQGYTETSIYTCPDQGQDADDEHFGHPPLLVGQERFYMEYLASIADNAVLVRNQVVNGNRTLVVRKTNEFLDLLTKEIEILVLFYSVEFDITSLLRIRFDTSKGRVTVTSSMKHFVALQGSKGVNTIIMLVIALVFCGLLVYDLVPALRKQRQFYDKNKYLHWPSLRDSAGDCCLGLFSFIMILMQLLLFIQSSQTMEDFVTALTNFPWAGGTESKQVLSRVKQDFLNEVSKFQDAFQTRTTITDASTILSIILLIRVVLCTSAHPRIALITKTIEFAASDLLHFFGLLALVFTGFACLGTWMFGSEREEFENPYKAFTTLCDSVLGPPGLLAISDTTSSLVEQAYVFLFHSICFFFMLNFILAIIVDAYTKVMEEVRECTVDMNIISDLVSIFRYQYLLKQHKFPLRRNIQAYLKGLDVKVVTAQDLHGREDPEKECFPNVESALAYFKHYEKYDFLNDEAEVVSEPKNADLAMIMALTLHKVETLQHRLEMEGEMSTMSRCNTPKRTKLKLDDGGTEQLAAPNVDEVVRNPR